jgi:hypothetical protein
MNVFVHGKGAQKCTPFFKRDVIFLCWEESGKNCLIAEEFSRAYGQAAVTVL